MMKNRKLIKQVLESYKDYGECVIIASSAVIISSNSDKTAGRTLSAAISYLDGRAEKPTAQELSEKIRSIKNLSDFEIFSFSYAAVKAAFLTLYKKGRSSFEIIRISNFISSLEIFDFDEFYETSSAVNKILLGRNPLSYRLCERKSREYIRQTVYRYAKAHGIGDIQSASICPIEEFEDEGPGKIYYPVIILLTLSLTFLSSAFFGFLSVFLLLPIYSALHYIADFVFSHIRRPRKVLSLKLDNIPSSGRTVAVFTVLAGDDNKKYLENLEDARARNKDKNIIFGLLADLPSHSSHESENDDIAIKALKDGINALNKRYGGGFCLFIRERSYIACEKCWAGRERKRGALIDLASLLSGKGNCFSTVICDNIFLQGSHYIATLDSDTEIYSGDIKRMVAAAMHPCNKPEIINGVVKKGYAIMQPRMEITMSGKSTPFSKTLFGSGGSDGYRNCSSDIGMDLFSRGIYCGKGLLDIPGFLSVCSTAFEDEIILSHDTLEGAYCRCAFLSDVIMGDSCPSNALSYYKRYDRWSRGDIQTLAYLFKRVRNSNGIKIDNPLDFISRRMIFENILSVLLPQGIFMSLLLALLFLPEKALTVASLATAPLVLPFLHSLFRFSGRRLAYKSSSSRGIFRSFCNFIYSLSEIPTKAYFSLRAAAKSLWRMFVSHRHLLEWTTTESSDRIKKGIIGYFIAFLPSFVIGIFFFIFSSRPIFDFFAFLFLIFPVICYSLSQSKKGGVMLGKTKKERYINYTRSHWRYFEEFVCEESNYLPPDNYREMPSPCVAYRTSPTNIGLYLLSALVASELDFIAEDELHFRISNALLSIEKLPKYRGHLYNWYNIKTLCVIGVPFISTVDSGNFIISLMTLQKMLEKHDGFHDETAVINKIIDNCDFSFLYNERRRMLSVGYNTANETLCDGCYDLLMSEARSTMFLSIAKYNLPDDCFYKPSRPLYIKNGRAGLYSWSGCMFEYFMPSLFLPDTEGSLIDESLVSAYIMQTGEKTRGVWGRSESAYYSFDSDMNYQYSAIGSRALSIDPGKNDDVISPYSSFLVCNISQSAVLRNLSRLTALGALGEYGFYDALDFTPSRVGDGYAVVRLYMAHHIGMSILAVYNLISGGKLIASFTENPEIRAALPLLKLRTPDIIKKAHKPAVRKTTEKKELRLSHPMHKLNLSSLSLSNGIMRITLLKDLGAALFYKDKAVTFPFYGENMLQRTMSLRIKTDKGITELLKDCEQSLEKSTVVCAKKENETASLCRFSLSGDSPVLCITAELSGTFSEASLLFLIEPILDRQSDYASHPAFSGLSVRSEFDKDAGILIFSRRAREGRHDETFLGVCLRSSSGFDFITRRDKAFNCFYDDKSADSLFDVNFDNNDGACILPLCAIKKKSSNLHGKYTVDIFLSLADKKSTLYSNLLSARNKKTNEISESLERYMLGGKIICKADDRVLSLLAPLRIILGAIKKSCISVPCDITPREALYRFGISGDLPLCALYIESAVNAQMADVICLFAASCRYSVFLGEKFDLAIAVFEDDIYHSPVFESIYRSLCAFLPFGNIYLIKCRKEELMPFTDFDMLLDENSESSSIIGKLNSIVFDYGSAMSNKIIKTLQNRDSAKMSGHFEDKGFTVKNGASKRAWSYIYSTETFGTLVTNRSLGFTFFKNSRECRLTPWKNDPLLAFDGEILCLNYANSVYDLAAISEKAFFGRANAVYSGSFGGIEYALRVGISNDKPIKYYTVTVKNSSDIPLDLALELKISFKSDDFKARHYTKSSDGIYTVLKNTAPGDSDGVSVFATLGKRKLTLKPGGESTLLFSLGAFASDDSKAYFDMTGENLGKSQIEKAAFDYAQRYEKLCKTFTLECPLKCIERMFNYYLVYQVAALRLNARSGLYQSSGAIGFRDQLQDTICLVYNDKSLLKNQIMLNAAHQFTEGDVLHWWHEDEKSCRGVRTRCSDDYLWLVFACTEYASVSGDTSIFDENAGYIEAPLLKDNESEIYTVCKKSEFNESIYYHCRRAAELSMNRIAENGLPLIGSGDWNDGFSLVGNKGRGTSVFVARFMQITLSRFSLICRKRKDDDFAERCDETVSRLSSVLEDIAFNGEYYLRGFYDDGSPIGGKKCDECRINLLPQAFAVFSGADKDRARSAMTAAMRELFNKDYKTLSLFTPPFDKSKQNPGYIKSYVPGVRENGGQYTHAAMWGALALFSLSMNKEGLEVLKGSCPCCIFSDKKRFALYGGEPYAVSGDIYTNEHYGGEAGWTQYTGGAGWMYRAILTGLLGYSENGKFFSIKPHLCDEFSSFKLIIEKKKTKYTVECRLSDKSGVLLDGALCEKDAFPFDKEEHFLQITVAKEGV